MKGFLIGFFLITIFFYGGITTNNMTKTVESIGEFGAGASKIIKPIYDKVFNPKEIELKDGNRYYEFQGVIPWLQADRLGTNNEETYENNGGQIWKIHWQNPATKQIEISYWGLHEKEWWNFTAKNKYILKPLDPKRNWEIMWQYQKKMIQEGEINEYVK